MTNTKRPIRVLPDGTRVYFNYTKYTPVPDDQRKYKRHKIDDERAVRWRGDWLLPLELLADGYREMPETMPDELAYEHIKVNLQCRCRVCMRPQAKKYFSKWRREHGLPA